MTDPHFEERAVPFELASSGDGLTLTGLAAAFNSPTRITGERHRNAPDGVFDEQIAPGAFTRSIKARTPKLMFDHGKHPMIGPMPIGSISTLREEARGLYVEARLHDNWLIHPIRDAIASGSVDGMSFRFQVPDGKESWDMRGDVPMRTIHEAKTVELGPVVFPAYADTSVAVRSLFSHLPEDAIRALLTELRDLISTSDGLADRGTPNELAAASDPLTHSGLTSGERAAFLRSLNLPRSEAA